MRAHEGLFWATVLDFHKFALKSIAIFLTQLKMQLKQATDVTLVLKDSKEIRVNGNELSAVSDFFFTLQNTDMEERTGLWWPRTAIRNFLDNSRKFNFCNRLILKLLHFFSIKKILKMYFLFFKDNLFLKRLNSFDFWKYYKLFLKR